MSDLIQRLRASAKGRYYWYCQHKIDKGINMSFEDYERHEAQEWFKERLSRYPDYYRNYEMVRVHVLDQTDKLMLEAADALEALSTQASGFDTLSKQQQGQQQQFEQYQRSRLKPSSFKRVMSDE